MYDNFRFSLYLNAPAFKDAVKVVDEAFVCVLNVLLLLLHSLSLLFFLGDLIIILT